MQKNFEEKTNFASIRSVEVSCDRQTELGVLAGLETLASDGWVACAGWVSAYALWPSALQPHAAPCDWLRLEVVFYHQHQ